MVVNSIWIVVFVSILIKHNGLGVEMLTYVEQPSLEMCESFVPFFLEKVKEQKSVDAVGITTACFEYHGTMEEYKAEQKRLISGEG